MLKLVEERQDYPVSIIFADMDNLKRVNDNHGHSAGDNLLKQTAEILSSAIRSDDILARVGGDEFAILLPQTDSSIVNKMILRLHAILTEYNEKTPSQRIQISLGTSTAKKGSLKEALISADNRMYTEKEKRKIQS
jgi:diguanylate cyclase (GGDEF)-like protein